MKYIILLVFTWNVYAYNTNDWKNFYYPNSNYLEELPTGVPVTFPIFICIDPNISNRRKQLIREGMDIWNKSYRKHVANLIKEGILYESDLGENIPDYRLFKILHNLNGSNNCPKSDMISRLNFRWRERYLFITETRFSDLPERERRNKSARFQKKDIYFILKKSFV